MMTDPNCTGTLRHAGRMADGPHIIHAVRCNGCGDWKVLIEDERPPAVRDRQFSHDVLAADAATFEEAGRLAVLAKLAR